MDEAKIKSVMDWPVPKSPHDIQVFLGFANFYRRFIMNYSKITKPLTKLLQKESIFEWNQDAQDSFIKIKNSFKENQLLAHPDSSKPYILETDASEYAIGGVLSQYDNDKNLRPVAFYSRQLDKAERNYEIYDKELLAIIDCFKEWRHFLQGATHQVTVLTDHKNLQYFMSSRQLTRRQARWSLFLSEFEFILTHRPGNRNQKADHLSRRTDYLPKEGEPEKSNFQQIIRTDQVLAAALTTTSTSDEFLEKVKKKLILKK
jgi:hypothetical protein